MSVSNESTATNPSKQARETIVVDLGKKKKKLVKQLRRGEGELMAEVNHVINELKAANAITGAAQAVVIVVTERDNNNSFPFFGFLR